MNFGELKIGESFYLRSAKKKYTKIEGNHATTDVGVLKKRHFYDNDIVLLPFQVEEKERYSRTPGCFCQIDNVNENNEGIIVISKRCQHHKHLWVDGNDDNKNGDFRK